MKKLTIFWDVDTQFDFMMPEGNLYVPGAESIIEKVSVIRKFALENGYSIISDIDWHSLDNEEISESPDFRDTFPPHCMAGTPGSERVGYLGDIKIDYIGIEKMPIDTLREIIAPDQYHIVIRKNSLNVFDNPNTDTLIKLINPKRAVIFGVALEFCVSLVLHGLSRFKNIELVMLSDAVKGLEPESESKITDDLRKTGVKIMEFAEFKRQL